MSARALRGTHGIVPVWSSVETQYKTIHQIVCDRWGRKKKKKKYVRSGIRTHAYKSRLRPERSALDRSAILTQL